MNTYHGYPVPSDCHPERPWWRRGRSITLSGGGVVLTRYWERIDGNAVEGTGRSGDTLEDIEGTGVALYDQRNPLPPPPPLCGQVWKVPEEPAFSIVCEEGPLTVRWGYEASTWGPLVEVVEEWPPAGAVLVAGPLSPWADTSEEAP